MTDLVSHASDIEKERSSKEKKDTFKDDPKWKQGLITCAQELVQTISVLIKYYNEIAKGEKHQFTRVIASCNILTAIAAQLSTAATVKANKNSEAQKKLQSVAMRVTEAANAVKEIGRKIGSREIEMVSTTEKKRELETWSDVRVKELELLTKIASLETQLESAQEELRRFREQQYK